MTRRQFLAWMEWLRARETPAVEEVKDGSAEQPGSKAPPLLDDWDLRIAEDAKRRHQKSPDTTVVTVKRQDLRPGLAAELLHSGISRRK